MTTIKQVLTSVGSKCALIPFITAGSPDLDTTEQALYILDQEGADVIEVGLPYSDPLADGPVIQEASKNALAEGVTFEQVLDLIARSSNNLRAPIILFTYYNPILARGIHKFLLEISEAGVKGLIVPDLPMEEADYVLNLCAKFSIELILLITPVSSDVRIDKILTKSQGTVYVVSSTGVTGMKNSIKNEMQHFIEKIKRKSDNTIIVGFGISTKEHVEQVSVWDINGIVIGSAFVKCLLSGSRLNKLKELRLFCASINKTLLTKI